MKSNIKIKKIIPMFKAFYVKRISMPKNSYDKISVAIIKIKIDAIISFSVYFLQ